MLSTKLFNSHVCKQLKILSQPATWKLLHISTSLTQDAKNHATATENKFRVYHGPLTPNMKAVKVFSLSTSIGGILAQPMLYNQAVNLGGSTPAILAICGFIGFFTFITPVMLHFVIKKYVTELEYNPGTNEYTATTLSFFMMKNKVTFTPDDVTVPDVPGMFASFHATDKTTKKSVPLFVDPKMFEDPTHYIKIMGYDKPLDFKLNLTEKEAEKK